MRKKKKCQVVIKTEYHNDFPGVEKYMSVHSVTRILDLFVKLLDTTLSMNPNTNMIERVSVKFDPNDKKWKFVWNRMNKQFERKVTNGGNVKWEYLGEKLLDTIKKDWDYLGLMISEFIGELDKHDIYKKGIIEWVDNSLKPSLYRYGWEGTDTDWIVHCIKTEKKTHEITLKELEYIDELFEEEDEGKNDGKYDGLFDF